VVQQEALQQQQPGWQPRVVLSAVGICLVLSAVLRAWAQGCAGPQHKTAGTAARAEAQW
jgi:hypothetical protein